MFYIRRFYIGWYCMLRLLFQWYVLPVCRYFFPLRLSCYSLHSLCVCVCLLEIREQNFIILPSNGMVLISTAISTQAAMLAKISMWSKQQQLHTYTLHTPKKSVKTENCLHFKMQEKNNSSSSDNNFYIPKGAGRQSTGWCVQE